MKKLFEKRNKTFRIFASILLAFIAIMAFSFAPIAATGVTLGFGLMVGGLDLTDSTLTEKEIKFLTAIKAEMDEHTKSMKNSGVNMEQIEAFLEKTYGDAIKNAVRPEALKSLEDLIAAANLEIAAMKEKTPTKAQLKTFIEQAKEQGISKEKIDAAIKSKSNLTFEIERYDKKQVGTIAYPSNAYVPFPTMDTDGWGEAPITKPVMKPICDTRTIATARATWVERGAREGAISYTDPGNAKDQLDFTPVVATATALKYAGYIKFPEELLDDVDNFLMETQADLVNTINKAEDAAFVAYMISKASAFDITGLTTTSPTKYECILSMVAQVRSNNFEPNAILLNPLDFCAIEFDAFQNGYAVVGWINGGGPTIGGVPVIQSNQITQGYAAVGDFKKVHIREFKNMNVRLGLSGDDFINNIFTVVGETRVIIYVKGGEEDALCYDAISDVKTAITTGS